MESPKTLACFTAGTPPDEVGVEGVDVVVVVHGGLGGPEALCHHLAAVYPAPRILRADPHVDVGAVGFECHKGGEAVDLPGHGYSSANR